MPATAFNLGRDCSIVLMGPYGRVDLQLVKDFTTQQLTHSVRVNPLGGVPLGQDIPNGWNFSFTIDRANSALDDLFAGMEASFWAGGVLSNSTLYQYVNEVGGAQTLFQFVGATLMFSDAGNWTAEASVKQKVSGFAGQRIKGQ